MRGNHPVCPACAMGLCRRNWWLLYGTTSSYWIATWMQAATQTPERRKVFFKKNWTHFNVAKFSHFFPLSSVHFPHPYLLSIQFTWEGRDLFVTKCDFLVVESAEVFGLVFMWLISLLLHPLPIFLSWVPKSSLFMLAMLQIFQWTHSTVKLTMFKCADQMRLDHLNSPVLQEPQDLLNRIAWEGCNPVHAANANWWVAIVSLKDKSEENQKE